MDLSGTSEREYWAYVAERPAIFVGRPALASLEAYLEGYDAHFRRHGGPGLEGWREWLVLRRGRDYNHAWPGQVRHLAVPNGWEHWELP